MCLNIKMNIAKKKLDLYVKKHGLNDEKTMKQSQKVNILINEYYKKHSK